jgi:hypothetical protein
MVNIKEIIEDIADDEEDGEECEEEHPQHKDERGGSYIDLVTINHGQDFQLKVKGRNMVACEKIFNRLYSKLKKNPTPVKNDGAYH